MDVIKIMVKRDVKLAPLVAILACTYSPLGVAEKSRPTLEEVVVTAQKRVENIRDVPISITALSEDFLNEAGITDVGELSRVAPNLVINATPYTGFVAMRGLGSGNNKGFERSVALVIDGVYYGRQDYLFEALADVQRIEVLRGPQGTLFGKNAIAGALNVTTGQASSEFSGTVSAMGGDLDRKRLRIAAGGALIEDALNIRVAWDEDVHDGLIHNTTFSQSLADNPDRGDIDENLRNRNNHIGRIRLHAPNVIDGLDVNFTATRTTVTPAGSGV
ncbi:MAG: TonB-dependent receptor plug domain-containing protein, partial [Spongiibacteraceae bacterium]